MEDRFSVSECLGILKNRESIYAFLSRVYRKEVSRTLLSELRDNLSLTVEENTDGEWEKVLGQFVKDLQGSDLSKITADLAIEYASLFLNAGRQSLAPFESVYTSKEKLMMQRARDEVIREYQQEGLGRKQEFLEPEDHIALEFEFMSILCRKTIKFFEKGDREMSLSYLRKQEQFLKKHLVNWIPDFARDMEHAVHSAFYLGIAKLTREYLSLETNMIPALIDEMQRETPKL